MTQIKIAPTTINHSKKSFLTRSGFSPIKPAIPKHRPPMSNNGRKRIDEERFQFKSKAKSATGIVAATRRKRMPKIRRIEISLVVGSATDTRPIS